MPRAEKKRRVCRMPKSIHFYAAGAEKEHGITMTVEEYETIRLIDHLAFTQEECAARMQVSRATVQMIYAGARKKLARFLIEGIPLQIDGGDYILCSTPGSCEDCKEYGRERQKSICETENKKKENQIMKIAVTYENGQIFQHFGHTKQFKVYEVEDGKIVKSEIVDTEGQGHGALAGFLFSTDLRRNRRWCQKCTCGSEHPALPGRTGRRRCTGRIFYRRNIELRSGYRMQPS